MWGEQKSKIVNFAWLDTWADKVDVPTQVNLFFCLRIFRCWFTDIGVVLTSRSAIVLLTTDVCAALGECSF